MTRFLVTTPGLSATRWVSFALALHPQVYAAHGKFALHSLDSTHAASSRRSDQDSLTHGNELRDFYLNSSLEEVFAAYRAAAPQSTVHGSVHSFTIHELQRRQAAGESLDGIQIINLTRHPVSYIDSHIALVRSAEQQPDLAAHYRQLLKDAVAHCPEARLVECPDPMLGLATVVSCFSASSAARDLASSPWPNVCMEQITTDVESLRQFCESLTGLSYADCDLAGHVAQGSMNSHRKGKGFASAQEIFGHWPPWQRDLYAMFMSPELQDQWLSLGYPSVSLGSTRAATASTTELVPPSASTLRCLGDFSGELGLIAERPPAELTDSGFCGYNLLTTSTGAIAFAESLGPVDWRTVPQRSLNLWQAEGKHLQAPSLEKLRAAIVSSSAKLMDSDHAGYNLVRFRGAYWAIAQSLGPLHLSEVSPEQWKKWEASGEVLKSAELDPLYVLLDQHAAPRLVESIGQFNIIAWNNKFHALAQGLGSVDLSQLSTERRQDWIEAGQYLAGATLDELRASLQPRLCESGYIGFNLIAFRDRSLALAEILGPVDLHAEQPGQLAEWKDANLCLESDSLDRLKTEIQTREPKLLVEDYLGFNIISGAGRIIGVSRDIGGVRRLDLIGPQVKTWIACGQWVQGRSIAEVQNAIQMMPALVIRQDFLGWNLIGWRGRFYAISPVDTPNNAADLPSRLERLYESGQCLWAKSLSEIEILCQDRSFLELNCENANLHRQLAELRGRLQQLEATVARVPAVRILTLYRRIRSKLGRVARGIRRRLPLRRAS